MWNITREDSQLFWGRDAGWKISVEPLRDTNPGMAQVDFKP